MKFIREIKMFKGKELSEEGEEIMERQFRIIMGEEDSTEYLRNLRLTKKKLKAYLLNHYSSRLADKFIKFFDFTTPLIYDSYVKQIEHIITRSSSSLEEHLNFIK